MASPASRTETITRVIDRVHAPAPPADEEGHRNRPVVEPGHWRESDPFLLMMEDWFTPGTFGDHPHRGIETITYVLDGTLEHRDNHGGHGTLGPGDAQWMTAGRGVVHSEEPSAGTVHSLQLWLNLPARAKMATPRYQDLRGDEVPRLHIQGGQIRVFSGRQWNVVGPALNHVPITMIEVRLEEGGVYEAEVPARDNCFLYVLDGGVRVGADERPLPAQHVAWSKPVGEDGTSALEIRASDRSRLLLWSGPPIREPVVARGPFVMNTEEQIREAYADYRAGRF